MSLCVLTAGRGRKKPHLVSVGKLLNFTHASFAENITTDGVELYTVAVGAQLKVGGCIIEISRTGKKCHQGCAIQKKITYICEMHIKIPTKHIDIIEDIGTCHTSRKAECAIYRVIIYLYVFSIGWSYSKLIIFTSSPS